MRPLLRKPFLLAATVAVLALLVLMGLYFRHPKEPNQQSGPDASGVERQLARPPRQQDKVPSLNSQPPADTFHLDRLLFSPDGKQLFSAGRSLPQLDFGSWELLVDDPKVDITH